MGSVVFDAVNSFFGHSHQSQSHYNARHEEYDRQTPPQTPRHRSRSRVAADTPMSSTIRGASSSSSRSTHHTQHHPPHGRTTTPAHSRNPSSNRHGAAELPQRGPFALDLNFSRDVETSLPRHPRPKIRIRDLEHIRQFARQDMDAFSHIDVRDGTRRTSNETEDNPQYDISGMKVEHVIEMVAGLLTKITTTNDKQHAFLHEQSQLESAVHTTLQTSSVLAFHGKNVPSITILSYLSRINKYCPTSYEVFLSLLVYFDRITERVNAAPLQDMRRASQQAPRSASRNREASESPEVDRMVDVTPSTVEDTQTVTPPASGGLEKAIRTSVPGTPHSRPQMQSPSSSTSLSSDEYNLSNFFVVDSFNIHRLVIAGVTCASKFFSDIFYTNSRYAKVGGLPLPELNHLELQFLLLNDFRLSVPAEEVEAYGTMLVEFYAREVVAQERAAAAVSAALNSRSLSESSTESTATVRAVE